MIPNAGHRLEFEETVYHALPLVTWLGSRGPQGTLRLLDVSIHGRIVKHRVGTAMLVTIVRGL